MTTVVDFGNILGRLLCKSDEQGHRTGHPYCSRKGGMLHRVFRHANDMDRFTVSGETIIHVDEN